MADNLNDAQKLIAQVLRTRLSAMADLLDITPDAPEAIAAEVIRHADGGGD